MVCVGAAWADEDSTIIIPILRLRKLSWRVGFQLKQCGFRACAPNHVCSLSIWNSDTVLPWGSQRPAAARMPLHKCHRTMFECQHLSVPPHRTQATPASSTEHTELHEQCWGGVGWAYRQGTVGPHIPGPTPRSCQKVSWSNMTQCPPPSITRTCFQPLGSLGSHFPNIVISRALVKEGSIGSVPAW